MMTTISTSATQRPSLAPASRVRLLISDTLVMARRSMIRYVRVPSVLFFALVQPVIFLLLFRYVFGNALSAGTGVDYADYIVPGILVQTSLFAASNTAVGLADDMGSGAIERFRTLPMARSALLTGRTIADTVRNAVVIAMLVGIGYLIGFDFHEGVVNAFGAVGLALLFGWSFSWIGACIGLSIRNSEAAQSASMMWMFPLMFTSSLFVPIESLPSWLESFANVNPVTFGVDAVRALSLGTTGSTSSDVLAALAWCLGLCVVFIPLATYLYCRAS